jgi:hypothetical protein
MRFFIINNVYEVDANSIFGTLTYFTVWQILVIIKLLFHAKSFAGLRFWAKYTFLANW